MTKLVKLVDSELWQKLVNKGGGVYKLVAITFHHPRKFSHAG